VKRVDIGRKVQQQTRGLIIRNPSVDGLERRGLFCVPDWPIQMVWLRTCVIITGEPNELVEVKTRSKADCLPCKGKE
jgi:hypothetical protein